MVSKQGLTVTEIVEVLKMVQQKRSICHFSLCSKPLTVTDLSYIRFWFQNFHIRFLYISNFNLPFATIFATLMPCYKPNSFINSLWWFSTYRENLNQVRKLPTESLSEYACRVGDLVNKAESTGASDYSHNRAHFKRIAWSDSCIWGTY
jgi:hypothetical protein